jgi:anti-sigma factor RsiW
LSALLDGELSPDDEAGVRSHLAECAACAAELQAVGYARSKLRELPMAQPPFGFLERAVRPHHTGRGRARRRVLRTAGATVAAALPVTALAALLVVSPHATEVSPPMAQLVAAHATSVATAPTVPGPAAPPATTPPTSRADLTSVTVGPAPVETSPVPDSLGGGLRRVAVDRLVGAVHALYSDGLRAVSLFEQSGHLDWSGLPAGGRAVAVGGRPARVYQLGGEHVVVWQAGVAVLTMVTEAPDDQLLGAAATVPEGRKGSPSLLSRLRQAARSVLLPIDD